MEIFDSILELVDANIVHCLIPLILTLIVAKIFFKNRFKTRQVLNLVRWFVLSYTVVTLCYFVVGVIFSPDKFSFIDRATGPYKLAYWVMFVSAALLPLSLLSRKLGRKPFYVLLVVFFMKIGWYFERVVIIATSYHQDYYPGHKTFDWVTFIVGGILITFLQGFILAIILLGIFELIGIRKAVRNLG